MLRLFKKTSKKPGLVPGTLVLDGDKKVEKATITIIDYDAMQFQEKEAETIEKCFPFKDTLAVTWINIDGIHQVQIIEKIGKHFNVGGEGQVLLLNRLSFRFEQPVSK